MRKCWLPAFSLFPTMFSKGFFQGVVKSWIVWKRVNPSCNAKKWKFVTFWPQTSEMPRLLKELVSFIWHYMNKLCYGTR